MAELTSRQTPAATPPAVSDLSQTRRNTFQPSENDSRVGRAREREKETLGETGRGCI